MATVEKIMSLTINLRQLEKHELRLTGELPVADLALGVEDDLVHANLPLQYDLTVEHLHDSLLVRGTLSLLLDCECSRCLKPLQQELRLAPWALHLPLEGEDKVSVVNDCVDLTPFVREDMLLDFPQHPLCRPDCAGLKTTAPEAEAAQKPVSNAWAELDKLKLK